jgi:type VI secretion system secreted protein VgrG
LSRKYTQVKRPLAVQVHGLDPDALLLVEFSCQEALSEPFQMQLDLLAEIPVQVAMDDLLGRSVTVEVELPGSLRPREKKRFFNGICRRVIQGEREDVFTRFRMELVPQFGLLTKRAGSRTFQHLTVKEILHEVLKDLRVDFKVEGKFEKRDYCVQYRESDFNFASRLMEEEGIFYYFTHGDGLHTMVLGNTPNHHLDLPQPTAIPYRNGEGGTGYHVTDWEKVQELRAGKVTLRDHSFEKPRDPLEATRPTQPEVLVGRVIHKLKGAANGTLELYDYPGEYAQRFDGVAKGGADQPDEVAKIYPDKERTALIRMQEETAAAVTIHGAGECRHFMAGHKFTLTGRRDTLQEHLQAEGAYVLSRVEHSAGLRGTYTTSGGGGFYYQNTFNCLPAALPYRPERDTPKPVIVGTQTAIVVGPKDEEVFTDKYGRVKVQFHWDRQGKNDLGSSCWVRVTQFWAGKRWGAHFWPRVGQEVVVAFLEGDPDQPIIVGSVYNAENLPPYELPRHKTQSGIKSRSARQGTAENYNEIRFEDQKGAEELRVHAERNLAVIAEANESRSIGGQRQTLIGSNCLTQIKGSQDTVVNGACGITMNATKGGYYLIAKQIVKIEGDSDIELNAKGNCTIDCAVAGVRAKDGIYLSCGGGMIAIDRAGNVYIEGPSVNINSGFKFELLQRPILGGIEAIIPRMGPGSPEAGIDGAPNANGHPSPAPSSSPAQAPVLPAGATP